MSNPNILNINPEINPNNGLQRNPETSAEVGEILEQTEEFKSVDIEKYIRQGLENGTLEAFNAIKTGKILARRGIVGEEIVTWSTDENGQPLKERVSKVTPDSVTNMPGWVVTKTDKDGNPVIDANGNDNTWIIPDSKFLQKYEQDTATNSQVSNFEKIYVPIKNVQIFVKINENICFGKKGKIMKIAKGGYVNITNDKQMYGISEKDFLDTYEKV